MNKVDRRSEEAVVTPDTDIIASQYEELQKSISDLINDGYTKIVIDLNDIDVVDSAGLGVFISAQNSLKDLGGKLEVINVSRYIMKLFTIMRLDKHFSVIAHEHK